MGWGKGKGRTKGNHVNVNNIQIQHSCPCTSNLNIAYDTFLEVSSDLSMAGTSLIVVVPKNKFFVEGQNPPTKNY